MSSEPGSEKNEIWRPIKGYAGYQVSNLGRARSLPRIVIDLHFGGERVRHMKGRILRPGSDSRGYLHIVLSVEGKTRTRKLARLVAETFHKNPQNLKVVNHIDGNKKNDCAENLEWCTYSENTRHALRIGLYVPLKGANNSAAKRVVNIKTGVKYGSIKDAMEQENITYNAGHMSHMLHGRDTNKTDLRLL